MNIIDLGNVLLSMSKEARDQAVLKRDYLGAQNTALLHVLSFILQTGADECLVIAKKDVAST